MVSLNRTIGTRAAKIASGMPEFDAAAQGIAREVRTEAAKHRLTGAFQSSIQVKPVRGSKGVTDRLVTSTDRAALSIEYGHFVRTKNGVKYVRGKHVFGNVAAKHR